MEGWKAVNVKGGQSLSPTCGHDEQLIPSHGDLISIMNSIPHRAQDGCHGQLGFSQVRNARARQLFLHSEKHSQPESVDRGRGL